MEERRDDARSRRPDGVSECDRAAIDVDLLPVEPELPAVGQRLRGEGLVDLDEVEGLDRKLHSIEQLADAHHGSQEQPLRLDLRLGVSDDACQGLKAEALDGPLADDHGRSRAVGDARCVAGRHGALGRVAAIARLDRRQREDGLEACERFERRVPARPLVRVDRRLAALCVHRDDGRDLVLEAAVVDGGDGPLMRLERERVLLRAGDVVLDRDPLRVGAHVALLHRAPQAVVHGRVDELAVPEPVAEAGVWQQVRCQVHAFHAARDHDLGIARLDLGRREHDRLQARAADAVDGRRAGARRKAGLEGRLACRRLTDAGLEDLAHEDVVDRRAFGEAGPLDGGSDGHSTKGRGGRRGERSAELADRRPDGRHEVDTAVSIAVSIHVSSLHRALRTPISGR